MTARTDEEQRALNERIKNTVTPNRMRGLKKALREARAYYVAKRAAAFEAGRAHRSNPDSGRLLLAYEAAIGEAVMARLDAKQMAHIVATRHVELGSRWSARGLANVQRANGAR